MTTDMTQTRPGSRTDIRHIERFLYQEADLLDGIDLEGWMELYTEDGTYWMPASPDQKDPTTEIAIIYDDRLLMKIRHLNYGHELAASMAYPVRSSHLIGNVRIMAEDETAGTITVRSNFHVALLYRGEQTIYAGHYTHELVPAGDSFRIRHKRVDILNADQPFKSLVIYL